MKTLISSLLATAMAFGAGAAMATDAAADQKALHTYLNKKFPGVEFSDYAIGAYALDADKRIQWESQQDFPPYLDKLDEGMAVWEMKFANGKDFTACFGSDVSEVRPKFPHWDEKNERVLTLELAINECLEANGEEPLGYKKGKMAYLSAYLAHEARGKTVHVEVPNDPEAQAAYEAGKQFFYAKRGQLNMACSDCHVYNSGMMARGDLLSPALGHTTHFPVWRGKWARATDGVDGFGTLHRRYGGCNKQVRAKPFEAQGETYRNLEFFHAAMSNGLEIDGPDYRQ